MTGNDAERCRTPDCSTKNRNEFGLCASAPVAFSTGNHSTFSGSMLIKCNCNNCSTHLEFENGNEGTIIQCPSCGLETTLYSPPTVPVPIVPKEKPSLNQPITDPRQPQQSTVAEALQHIRSSSCYNTLRGFITLVQAIWIFFSCLIILSGILLLASEGWTLEGIAYGVFSVLVGAACIIMSFVVREASLLMVDIADCQIQLVRRSK